MTASFQDSDSSGPPREGEKVIASGVLAAVDRALDVAKEERLRYLEGCAELDAAGRQTAERLLRECERCEELDRVAVASEEGPVRDALDRAPFVLDLAALVAEAEADGSASRRLAAETRLGPYRVVRFVAAGGMGEVYEAVDERVGRRVAVKVLPACASEERAARFSREAILMARLEHPAIARLYESGRARQGGGKGAALDYIAMEYIEGRSLGEAAEALRKAHPGDPRLLVELLLPIVDAVAYAHARGVLHRDIKPANILVETGVEAGVDTGVRARLLDFGVASLLGPDEHLAMTATGDASRPGTLAYMSPEQIRGGSSRVTTQSDVYALGLVPHESLTGRRVVETDGRGLGEVVEDVLKREAPSIVPNGRFQSSRTRETWRALDFVLRRALRKEPAARQSSAAALAEDLRRVLAGEQPAGRRLGAIEALEAFSARHRRAIAVGAAVATVAGVALAFGAIQFVRAREAEARSDLMIGGLLEGSKPLIVDLNQRLLAEGQPLAVRRAALEATVRYLEWVQANAADDERVLSELADRYRLLGSVAGSAATGSLGDTETARVNFERSRAILDDLLARRDDKDLRLRRSHLLREYGGLFDIEERERLFRLATDDQRAALALMPPGLERDNAERLLLTTEVQAARTLYNLAGFERPIARFRELAAEERFARDAEFLSEHGLALRHYADVLEPSAPSDATLATAREAEQAFRASIAQGLDEFTNNRHLARLELMITRITALERTPNESLAALVAALARSRNATLLKPGDSFARLSHFETLGRFADAARGVAEQFRAQAGSETTEAEIQRFVDAALEAFDRDLAFAEALPLEGAPHTREALALQDVAKARAALEALHAAGSRLPQ